MGSDNVTEKCLIPTLLETIGSTLLFIRPPDGQVGGSGQLVVHNRAIANGGAYKVEAAPLQDFKKGINCASLYDLHCAFPFGNKGWSFWGRYPPLAVDTIILSENPPLCQIHLSIHLKEKKLYDVNAAATESK